MVKLSVSKAARILGISRADIQSQINSGKLQTHEGYVTTDSLRLAYPNLNLYSEQDRHIQKMQKIRNNAIFKVGSSERVKAQNEQKLMEAIAILKTQLNTEKAKNQHYAMVFHELLERLEALEQCCHAEDRDSLHKLQHWVGKQTPN